MPFAKFPALAPAFPRPLHDAAESRARQSTGLMFVQSVAAASSQQDWRTPEEPLKFGHALDRLAAKTVDWILSKLTAFGKGKSSMGAKSLKVVQENRDYTYSPWSGAESLRSHPMKLGQGSLVLGWR